MGVEIVFEATMKLLKALIKEKKFLPDIHLLMRLGVLGAFIIGKYIEGVLLFLIFGGAHFLEDLVSKRSSANIEKLLNLTPPKARLNSRISQFEFEDIDKQQYLGKFYEFPRFLPWRANLPALNWKPLFFLRKL